METEILKDVLTDVLEDLREIKQQQVKQTKVLTDVGVKVEGFEQKMSDIKVSAPAVDTIPLIKIIENGIDQINNTIETQPKSVIRQFRFLLFPEHYAEQYYRIVFGRLLFWMIIFLIATYLFSLSRHLINTLALVKQNDMDNDHYKKAWQYLYKYENKNGKRKMDSVWYKE